MEGAKRSSRQSKYEPLINLWEQASGEAGLTLDQMDEVAKSAGHELERNILRSIVFAQKQTGRVTVRGDRYVWHIANALPSPTQEDSEVTDKEQEKFGPLSE